MHRKTRRQLKLLALFTGCLTTTSYAASHSDQAAIRKTVNKVIQPLIQQYNIPGMAVAVTLKGQHYFYNYGVASRTTQQRLTPATLFEIGSISKTFTATLTAYAQVNGQLALSASVSQYLPALRGSSFDHISLLNLGTHTVGGLPLQVPDKISNTTQLMDYCKHWKPTFAAGTCRTYSNLGIGLLGLIAAQSAQESFDEAIEKQLFPALGMTHSYLNVPADQIQHYAQGYTKKDAPIRMQSGVLASEAYGVKSSAVDMLRFIEDNMQEIELDGKWQRALTATHTAYFRAGGMTQDLIWEQYPYPVELKQVLAGNSVTMGSETTPATKLSPPVPPQARVLINKTGSTNGFAAYVAFIPAKKMGIVLLANKNYPVAPRVTAAYQILTRLDS